jgi:hypothetical protein
VKRTNGSRIAWKLFNDDVENSSEIVFFTGHDIEKNVEKWEKSPGFETR